MQKLLISLFFFTLTYCNIHAMQSCQLYAIDIPLLPVEHNAPSIKKNFLILQGSMKKDEVETTVQAHTKTFLDTMFNKRNGKVTNDPKQFNPLLYALVKNKETYFSFNPVNKGLSLVSVLGEYKGWGIQQIVEVEEGRAECVIYFGNMQKNKHEKIALHLLKNIYENTGKNETFDAACKEDVTKLALFYLTIRKSV